MMRTGNVIHMFSGNAAVDMEQQVEEIKKPEPKLRKDGKPKNTKQNKLKGKSSEVYPFQIPDLKKMLDYFKGNQMWKEYLIFVFSCNMARRIGDTLSLKWRNIMDPSSGQIRDKVDGLVEQKTDKIATPHINSACRDAINLYIEKTGVDPSENDYTNDVFLQLTGGYKGRTLTDSAFRKSLNKAAEAVGITYNIGTHSARKTFGMIMKSLYRNDPNIMETLQEIYNHSDSKTTNRYIGITRESIRNQIDGVGDFWTRHIVGEEEIAFDMDMPIITLDSSDLRDIIAAAYKAGQDNAGVTDSMCHIKSMNDIMAMVEGCKK